MQENHATQIVKSMTRASDNQVADIMAISRLMEIKKGHHFVSAGDIPRNFAFVMRGLFRYFYMDEKGNEFTKGFFQENSVISSYSALIENRESFFTIEALENSLVLIVDYLEWKDLLKNDPTWHQFLIRMLEKGYCTKEAREREFLLFDAEARYKSFLKRYPGLDSRIKQHLIASYIGITPVALSRIRKKMGIVNMG